MGYKFIHDKIRPLIKGDLKNTVMEAIKLGTLERIVFRCPECGGLLFGYWIRKYNASPSVATAAPDKADSPYPFYGVCDYCKCKFTKKGNDDEL